MVWEYTDNSTGDTSSAKEVAPKETAAKKGQVCAFLSGHTLIFPWGSSCGICAVVCLPVILFTALLFTLVWFWREGLTWSPELILQPMAGFQPQPLEVLGLWA